MIILLLYMYLDCCVNDTDQLSFPLFVSCTSYVGKTGRKQMLSLARGCWYTHTVAHEFGMVLVVSPNYM